MLLLSLSLLAYALADRPIRAEEIEVRVGVVAYQDSDRGAADLDRLLDDLAKSIDKPVRFQLASGAYGDVIHWLDKQLIDVALLTPGVFVEALKLEDIAQLRCQYLASRLLRPADPPAGKAAPSSGYRDRYRAACVTAERSPLRTINDVRQAWRAGHVRFVFVDPFSASGRMAPAFALKQAGIRPAPEEVEYSYSHTNSMRLLGPAEDGLERVAFVWDGAWTQAAHLPPFRRLEFPQFDALTVPADVVVARADFEHADRVVELLTSHRDENGQRDFARFDDWRSRYAELSRWAADLHLALDSDEVQAVSLDGLGQMLRHYARTRPENHAPRLALVLSGGGAKCAYQIGAVIAIEERLAALRRETGDEGLSISLVAGTSGGAINALAIALGTSQTPPGQAELRNAWRALDQREIVRPSRLVRGNMGLWFVCVELAITLFAARQFLRQSSRRAWWVVALLLFLAAAQLALSYAPFAPWTFLGDRHLLHHAWLWSTFGFEWAGWCLLALGLWGAWRQRQLSRVGKILALPQWLTAWGLTIGLLGLPLAQLATIFFYERTLSDGAGMERRLLQSFSDLAQFRARELGGPPLESTAGAAMADGLKSVSRQVMSRKLLARDLVVTGSCLERSREDLPSDLYFYAPAGSESPPADYGERGISLAERPDMLLDVVLGSGSVFPVFPPRTLRDFPERGESVDLVDGGFAHNSPIEAAVRWGATHIILIEADPRQRTERRNFLQNAAGAFNHLYHQAQLVDARSREKERVVIFSLRPDSPHLCMLDFAGNLIEAAIDKGYREARGESLVGRGGARRFRKELGPPQFWAPAAP